MQRPVLHNRYLSDDLHRLANGAIGGLLCLLLTTSAVRYFGFPLWLLWLSVPVGLVCTVLPPSRFTLVEGCAGGEGYDELDEEPPSDTNT
jgi:hypothetical protein